MNDDSGGAPRPDRLPPDDARREPAFARPDEDGSLPHIGMVGDTYTILLTGEDTAGRYCLIDMHVPHGGGPPPHSHDFEEMFSVLEGEIEVTFRGERSVVRAGEAVNVPANAPHSFTNASEESARLLCVCSPAGQEDFFEAVGVRVGGRTEAPPELDEATRAEFLAKAAGARPEIPDRAPAALRRSRPPSCGKRRAGSWPYSRQLPARSRRPDGAGLRAADAGAQGAEGEEEGDEGDEGHGPDGGEEVG